MAEKKFPKNRENQQKMKKNEENQQKNRKSKKCFMWKNLFGHKSHSI